MAAPRRTPGRTPGGAPAPPLRTEGNGGWATQVVPLAPPAWPSHRYPRCVEGNGGWATQVVLVVPPNVTVTQLRTSKSQSHLHTFVDAAVPQLPIYRLQQQSHSTSGVGGSGPWKPFAGLARPDLRPLPKTLLGEERFSWTAPSNSRATGGIVATVALTAEAQAVVGQGVWFGVRALCNHSGTDWHRTNLTMLIDPSGTGEWEVVSSWLASENGASGCAPYWQTYSIATILRFDVVGEAAQAKFALVVQGANPMPLTLADVAVAPLGVGWASMR